MEPFDTTILHAHYCMRPDGYRKPGRTYFDITSEESFFIHRLFRREPFSSLLPSLRDDSTLADLSLHFLKVYAALWCCPLHKYVAAGDWLIRTHLHDSLGYTAVHKRQLEGACSDIFAQTSSPADFSPHDLPMQRPEWQQAQHHPLCDMPLPFVLAVMDLHRRNGSDIFVAWDGQGDSTDLLQHGAVFSGTLDLPVPTHNNNHNHNHNHNLNSNQQQGQEQRQGQHHDDNNIEYDDDYDDATTAAVEAGIIGSASSSISASISSSASSSRGSGSSNSLSLKFLDLFVAMHGELFLLNPRSTFSWEAYLVRVCLGLYSVPVLRTTTSSSSSISSGGGKDIRSLTNAQIEQGQLWPLLVSWTSVLDAFTGEAFVASSSSIGPVVWH